MRPEERIAASSENALGVILLMAKSASTRIRLLGSTMKASIAPGSQYVNSFSIVPPDSGLVAVQVEYHDNNMKRMEEVSFFLHVKNDGQNAEVNLRDEWFAPAARLSQVVGDYIEVMVGDERFTSDQDYAKGGKPGKRYVADPDLLCKYAFGDISAQAVIDAADDACIEADALAEAAKLRKTVEFLERAHQLIRDEFKQKIQGVASQNDELANDIASLKNVTKVYRDLVYSFLDLERFWPWQFIKRGRLREDVIRDRFLAVERWTEDPLYGFLREERKYDRFNPMLVSDELPEEEKSKK